MLHLTHDSDDDQECYELSVEEEAEQWSEIMAQTETDRFDPYEQLDASKSETDDEKGMKKGRDVRVLCRFCGNIFKRHLERHVVGVHAKLDMVQEAMKYNRLAYLIEDLKVFSKHTLQPETNIVKAGQIRCEACTRVGAITNVARHKKHCLRWILLDTIAKSHKDNDCGVMKELRTLRSAPRVHFYEQVPEAVNFLKRKYICFHYIAY